MRKQENDTLSELYDRLWKSKSARLNAYQRLSKTYVLSSYSTSFLAVYVIVLSLLQPFKIITDSETVNFLNLESISISIILLVFVLMESSMQYNLKAEKFHVCAKSLGKLYKKFEFIKDDPKLNEEAKYIKYSKIQKRYDEIIELYENHRPIDFKYFQVINNLKSFNHSKTKLLGFELKIGNFNKWYVKFKYNHLIYIHYYIVIFVIPILLVMLILALQ